MIPRDKPDPDLSVLPAVRRHDSPIRALLIDMDNTVFDLIGAQMTACEAVMKDLGINGGNPLYPYFLRPVHGYESHENILDFLHDRGIAPSVSCEAACRIYEDEKLRSISLYPGVADTLGYLHEQGIPMGIITDAHTRDAVRRLEKTGLLPLFSCMVTFDIVRVKKPAPEPFITSLGMLMSAPEDVLLVGDSPRRDIRPAHALGIRTAYARYGDRFSRERSCPEADFCIDRIDELRQILHRFF